MVILFCRRTWSHEFGRIDPFATRLQINKYKYKYGDWLMVGAGAGTTRSMHRTCHPPPPNYSSQLCWCRTAVSP